MGFTLDVVQNLLPSFRGTAGLFIHLITQSIWCSYILLVSLVHVVCYDTPTAVVMSQAFNGLNSITAQCCANRSTWWENLRVASLTLLVWGESLQYPPCLWCCDIELRYISTVLFWQLCLKLPELGCVWCLIPCMSEISLVSPSATLVANVFQGPCNWLRYIQQQSCSLPRFLCTEIARILHNHLNTQHFILAHRRCLCIQRNRSPFPLVIRACDYCILIHGAVLHTDIAQCAEAGANGA